MTPTPAVYCNGMFTCGFAPEWLLWSGIAVGLLPILGVALLNWLWR